MGLPKIGDIWTDKRSGEESLVVSIDPLIVKLCVIGDNRESPREVGATIEYTSLINFYRHLPEFLRRDEPHRVQDILNKYNE